MPSTLLRRAFVALALAFATGLVPTGAARACSCSQVSPEDAIRGNGVIFRGRVTAVEQSSTGGFLGTAGNVATVAVQDRWKGEVPDVAQVVSGISGASCGVRFDVGQDLTFFAGVGGDGRFYTHLCSMLQGGGDAPRRARLDALLRDYADTLRRADAAVAGAPASVSPLLERARFHEEWRDLPRSAADFAAAVALAPGDARGHAGLGRVEYARQRFAEASASLARAAALDPANADTRRLLNQARLRSGDVGALASVDFRGLVVERLDLWRQDLNGRDLRDARFSAVDLSAANLRGADLRGARISGLLAGADLRDIFAEGAQFSGNLTAARFDGARLDGAGFFNSTLLGARFRGISGQGSNFEYARLAGADFTNADVRGARFIGTGPFISMEVAMTGTRFTGARLAGANFANANLADADFAEADTTGADFAGAHFNCRTRFPEAFRPIDELMVPMHPSCAREPIDYSGRTFPGRAFSLYRIELPNASFRGATLPSMFARGANLAGADFSGARIGGADFLEADLRGARFDRAQIDGGNFVSANLAGASFHGARVALGMFANGSLAGRGSPFEPDRPFTVEALGFLRGAIVQCDRPGFDPSPIQVFVTHGCGPSTPFDVRGADLSHYDLSYADLRNFDFTGANLRGANLENANLTGARLTGADLFAARYEGRHPERTRWPAGFDLAREAAARRLVALFPHMDTAELNMEGQFEDSVDVVVPDFAGQDLSGFDLRRTWLREARLVGASLHGARLEGANLFRADLRRADLRGADLRGAILDQANLTEAQHDARTRWPEGFSLSAAAADTARRAAPPRDPASLPQVTVRDCNAQAGYEPSIFVDRHAAGPELIVLGLYETESRGWGEDHRVGRATVRVERTVPHVLVLSSFTPTVWRVDLAPGARVEQVIVGSTRPGSAVEGVPAELVFTDRSREGPREFASAYAWPGDRWTRALVAELRDVTGRGITAFAGCYQASRFFVGDWPAAQPGR
jgi:uncharacterized protein YjbI with pentapeptide repeats